MPLTPQTSPLNADFLKTVPHEPGVYLMKDIRGGVLYVGKARDLRKRLASYVTIPVGTTNKTAKMVEKVGKIDTIITRTEKEALILEASLIKKHKPKYNILLRDDKNYPYLKVTVNEQWPRVVMTRRRVKDGARYFGPYSSASAMWETLHLLNALFPLRRCKEKKLPPRARPCLNFQMRQCLAPCCPGGGKADPARYKEMVDGVLMVLEGRNQDLRRRLESRMKEAAAALDFEEAALCRDRISALGKTLEKQVMIATHYRDQDVFGVVRADDLLSIAVLSVRNGQVSGSRTFLMSDAVGEEEDLIAEVLRRYYGDGRPVPSEILLPVSPVEGEVISEWLSELRGARVSFLVPKRGDLARLTELARANAEKELGVHREKNVGWKKCASAMMKILHMENIPFRIECLDISTFHGDHATGSLVCFTAGEKFPGGYRHYKIRTIAGSDDYGMMAEVLGRRFRKGADNTGNPDLLVVDGGKGQLNVAVRVLADLGFSREVEVVAIAKSPGNEADRLFRPGRMNPIVLPRHSPVLLFLMRLRDESHRYGITFHRKWRQRETFSSILDRAPGVGSARKKALLTFFGSLEKIRAAPVEELAMVPGFGPALARSVRKFLDENI